MATARRTAPGSIALWALLLLPATMTHAGGPLLVRGNGTPYVWSTLNPISYRTDNGPLSANFDEMDARARVLAMFNVWQNVGSANIGYNRAGFINSTTGFSDGNVSTGAEYNAVLGTCNSGSQSPIIYDADGAIFTDLAIDVTSVLGFAGPCTLDASNFLSGQAVMNGRFQDGQPAPDDIPTAAFDAAFIHEFGHFSGLDHSQINVNCQAACSTDDLSGLPTMFPLLVSATQGQLSVDDIAWISSLYPQTGPGGFAATHGTITGTVFFSDGASHAQLVNVIARQVDTGLNQDRTTAASVVSGYRFRTFHGNSILNNTGSSFGGVAPALVGLYEIPVPPGNYTVEVESIDPGFTEGSSVGGPILIPMPGTAPVPIGPISVAPGSATSGHDIVLIGTDPRFDQFEGP